MLSVEGKDSHFNNSIMASLQQHSSYNVLTEQLLKIFKINRLTVGQWLVLGTRKCSVPLEILEEISAQWLAMQCCVVYAALGWSHFSIITQFLFHTTIMIHQVGTRYRSQRQWGREGELYGYYTITVVVYYLHGSGGVGVCLRGTRMSVAGMWGSSTNPSSINSCLANA